MQIVIMSDTQPFDGGLYNLSEDRMQELLNSLYTNLTYVDASGLAHILKQEYPFCDSFYGRSKITDTNFLNHRCWSSQQLFFLAVNKNSIDDFIKDCRILGIMPSVIFEADSPGNQRVRYAAFLLETSINDLRIRYATIASLRRLFDTKERLNNFKAAVNDSFKSFKMLYFENVDILHIDDETSIDIVHLLDITCCKIHSEGGSHGERAMRDFLDAINMHPDYRGALIHMYMKSSARKRDINKAIRKYIYDVTTPYYNARIFFKLSKEAFVKNIFGSNKTFEDFNIMEEICEDVEGIKWETVDNIEQLTAKDNGCIMLRSILDGEKEVGLRELRSIAVALRYIKGVQTLIANKLMESGKYSETSCTMVKSLMERYRRIFLNRQPLSCRDFCDCITECHERIPYCVDNIMDLLPQKQGTIRKLKIQKKILENAGSLRRKILTDFEADLMLGSEGAMTNGDLIAKDILSDEDLFECDTYDTDDLFSVGEELPENPSEDRQKEVFVYRCFVGLGKTHMYVNKAKQFIKQKKTVIIAFPDHSLKNDVKKRLLDVLKTGELKKKVIVVPELPNISEDFNGYIKSLYAVGATKIAKAYIKSYIKENIKSKPEEERSESEKQLIDYYYIPIKLHWKNYGRGKIILCTHERLFQLSDLKVDYTIIDEDIVNTLLKQGSVSIKELERLKEFMLESQDDRKHAILERVNYILQSEPGKIQTSKPEVKAWGVINNIAAQHREDFGSRISELLFDCEALIKSQNMINFITKHSLQLNGKLFIMSATANEKIYKQLFGENIVFRDYSIPKMKASFIMLYNSSYSRGWIDKNLDKLNLIEESILENGDMTEIKKTLKLWGISEDGWDLKEDFLIITHKKYESKFKELGFQNTMHYGKLTGIDAHNGRDLIVFGTPHANAVSYALVTKVLFPCDDLRAIPKLEKDVLVTRNGYGFYFTTVPEDSNFREIQFWMIESEMIQAIGRARPIDNKCNIYIWSNLPLPEINLNLETWDDVMK